MRATEHQAVNLNNQANESRGMRARSTTVRNSDGTTSNVINIGVPQDHPLADRDRQAGSSGLYNLRVNGMQMPEAPEFVISNNNDGQRAGPSRSNPMRIHISSEGNAQ